ncbi:MAG: hypothetical protein R3B90_14205 [Planctomycetaceae bacterium]
MTAEAFAGRLAAHADNDPDRLRYGFELVTGRPPEAAELASSLEYARRHGLANTCRVLLEPELVPVRRLKAGSQLRVGWVAPHKTCRGQSANDLPAGDRMAEFRCPAWSSALRVLRGTDRS